ncbi:MAG: hypothetical protein WDO68_03535 [Gammaproteobacteria bacterium]
MKRSLWFDVSMLVLILIASLASTVGRGPARHGAAQSENPASTQPERLASGS